MGPTHRRATWLTARPHPQPHRRDPGPARNRPHRAGASGGLHHGPLPARKPRPRARDVRRHPRDRRTSSALTSSTRRPSTRRTAPAINTARGLGLDASLDIFNEIRETSGLPVLTDVHLPDQCAEVAKAVDVLQIPAFLSRQTDLLVAAAQTGRADQREEGPVHGPVGHEERRQQAGRNPAAATCSCASAASPSATTRSSPTCARCLSWRLPARRWCSTPPTPCSSPAGRARRRRPAPVRPHPRPRRRRRRHRLRLHRNAREPRQGASDGPNMVPLNQLETLMRQIMASRQTRRSRSAKALHRPLPKQSSRGVMSFCAGNANEDLGPAPFSSDVMRGVFDAAAKPSGRMAGGSMVARPCHRRSIPIGRIRA